MQWPQIANEEQQFIAYSLSFQLLPVFTRFESDMAKKELQER